MNLIYIYIYLDIYIYILISRSNIINLSVYEFINFRYMNVTLNVFVDLTVSKVGAFCRGRNLPSARGFGT